MDVKTWTRLRSLLAQIMGQLDRRERLIIRCRYALGGHRKVKTFQAIAERLGVSKERVRQLEQRAMMKLRTMAAELNMEDVLEPSLRRIGSVQETRQNCQSSRTGCLSVQERTAWHLYRPVCRYCGQERA